MRLLDKIRKSVDAKSPLESKVVSVPEWGVDIMVCSLPAMARIRLATLSRGGDSDLPFDELYRLVARYCFRDPETRKPVFETDAEVDAILAESGDEFMHLCELAFEISGFDANSVDQEATKGFTLVSGE